MVRDYKGDATIAQGEVFDPSPANIESRVKRTKIGGLDVALLPKENRGDSVVANLTLRFGDEKSLMNRAEAAQFAGQLLDRGTSKHTRQQIQDEFDRLKAQVRVFGGPTSAGVSIETTRQNLPATIRLVGEILREPAFPARKPEKRADGDRFHRAKPALQYLSQGTSVVCRLDGRNACRYPGRYFGRREEIL